MCRMIAVLVLGLTFSTTAMAVEGPSVEVGKALFESPALGTNGKSCAACHPDGKGLDEIAAYDDGMLKEIINFCIRDAMKGQMLSLESTEVESMRMYVRRFQKN